MTDALAKGIAMLLSLFGIYEGSVFQVYACLLACEDLREENLINLLRLYEYKRFCHNSVSIYLRYLPYSGKMLPENVWL